MINLDHEQSKLTDTQRTITFAVHMALVLISAAVGLLIWQSSFWYVWYVFLALGDTARFFWILSQIFTALILGVHMVIGDRYLRHGMEQGRFWQRIGIILAIQGVLALVGWSLPIITDLIY